MKKLQKYFPILGSAIASLALFIGISSANSPCFLYLHQPKVPEAMKRFKK